jgi:MFS transporter, PAT family, solute carrier family 33 (acetyl-CoA transportor), member 1
VDFFTIATCHVKEAGTEFIVKSPCIVFIYRIILNNPKIAAECVSDHGKSQCADISGECITERDGYFYVSAVCLTFGVAFLLSYIIPTARKLQGESNVTPMILQNI